MSTQIPPDTTISIIALSLDREHQIQCTTIIYTVDLSVTLIIKHSTNAPPTQPDPTEPPHSLIHTIKGFDRFTRSKPFIDVSQPTDRTEPMKQNAIHHRLQGPGFTLARNSTPTIHLSTQSHFPSPNTPLPQQRNAPAAISPSSPSNTIQ